MVRAFGIHLLGIGGNDIACDVAHDVEHLVIRVHGIGLVLWSLGILVLVGKTAFLELHDAWHEGAVL